MVESRPWPLPSSDGLLIHHVSDTHFGYRPWSFAESDHMLDDLRQGLIPPVDVLVHTGDITDHGRPAEDAYALDWLKQAELQAPSLIAMGNHDVRDRPVHTRATWEKVYGRSANTFVDVQGVRLVTFAVDSFTGHASPWIVPDATWDWLDGVVAAAPGPVILVNHYPPKELGVKSANSLQPASRLDDLVHGHPKITGMLCGHMHKDLSDPAAAQFLTIGGRPLPVLCDISSMLSIGVLSRDQSAQLQSHSAYVTVHDDRWEVRYRAHGTHSWSGPNGQRLTTLDLKTGKVRRSM